MADSLPRVCLDLAEMSGEEVEGAGAAICCWRRALPLVFMIDDFFAIKLIIGKMVDVGSDGVVAPVMELDIAAQNSPPNGFERP